MTAGVYTPTVSSSAYPLAGSSHSAANVADPAALTATTPAAITATTPAPAGGSGATAGAYDTAQHRDTAIAAINALEADVVALRTTVAALLVDLTATRTTLAALQASLRTGTILV
jgi:hypothetical protein